MCWSSHIGRGKYYSTHTIWEWESICSFFPPRTLSILNWLNGRIDFSAKSSTQSSTQRFVSEQRPAPYIIYINCRKWSCCWFFCSRDARGIVCMRRDQEREREICVLFFSKCDNISDFTRAQHTSCHVLLHLFFSFNEHFHPQLNRKSDVYQKPMLCAAGGRIKYKSVSVTRSSFLSCR
jgi:hypothetical protein